MFGYEAYGIFLLVQMDQLGGFVLNEILRESNGILNMFDLV